MPDISLSHGVRQNLLSLQRTADLQSLTQNRLATGKRVNSALDDPTNFFVSEGLKARAGDLSRLLDAMGLAVKTLEAADQLIPKVKVVDEATDETCEQCGKPMVIKWGRFGRFIACSGYPECKKTKPLLVKIGVKCPKCGGEIVEKQSKKKRIFYGCANYPNCDFTNSTKPLPQPCPQCGDMLVMRGKSARCLKCEFSTSLTKLEQEVLKV